MNKTHTNFKFESLPLTFAKPSKVELFESIF